MRLLPSLVILTDAQHCTSENNTRIAVIRSFEHQTDTLVYASIFLVPTAYLEELCTKLNCEDPNTRPLRRALGFMDILNKVKRILKLVT